MKTSNNIKDIFKLAVKLMFVLALITSTYACEKEDTPEPLVEGLCP